VNCWPSVGVERRIPVSVAGSAGSNVIPQTTDGLSAGRGSDRSTRGDLKNQDVLGSVGRDGVSRFPTRSRGVGLANSDPKCPIPELGAAGGGCWSCAEAVVELVPPTSRSPIVTPRNDAMRMNPPETFMIAAVGPTGIGVDRSRQLAMIRTSGRGRRPSSSGCRSAYYTPSDSIPVATNTCRTVHHCRALAGKRAAVPRGRACFIAKALRVNTPTACRLGLFTPSPPRFSKFNAEAAETAEQTRL